MFSHHILVDLASERHNTRLAKAAADRLATQVRPTGPQDGVSVARRSAWRWVRAWLRPAGSRPLGQPGSTLTQAQAPR